MTVILVTTIKTEEEINLLWTISVKSSLAEVKQVPVLPQGRAIVHLLR
jgi:hypothetical protein